MQMENEAFDKVLILSFRSNPNRIKVSPSLKSACPVEFYVGGGSTESQRKNQTHKRAVDPLNFKFIQK